jgi:hypothetical protein
MDEAEPRGVETEPLEGVQAAPVSEVADDRVPQLGELNADLPSTTRPEP